VPVFVKRLISSKIFGSFIHIGPVNMHTVVHRIRIETFQSNLSFYSQKSTIILAVRGYSMLKQRLDNVNTLLRCIWKRNMSRHIGIAGERGCDIDLYS
jgi:hypothetical protein